MKAAYLIETISFRCSSELYDAIARLAREKGWSISKWCYYAMLDFVDHYSFLTAQLDDYDDDLV